MPKLLNRSIRDFSLSANSVLPNAANTVNTAGIYLGDATPFPVTEQFQIQLTVDTATGANSKNVNCVLQDSADNATFANVAGVAAPLLVATGNSANVIGANIIIAAPYNLRAYVRGSATGEANGGNAADGKLTIDLLF